MTIASARMVRPRSRVRKDERGAFGKFILTTKGLIIARISIVVAVLSLWEFASGRLVSKFWLSSPSAIVNTLATWFSTGTIWTHLEATLTEMGLGYVIGCIAGVVLGLVLGFFPTVYRVVMPFLGGFYCLPKIALAPLFVILLGIDLGSKVALVAISVFFLILYATLDGINDIDRDLIQALRLMGATPREVSTKILIPGCLRWVFTGMRIAVRYAFTAAILGEVIASNRGIGYLIEAYSGQYNSTSVFAAMLILVVCSLTVSEALTRWESSASHSKAGV